LLDTLAELAENNAFSSGLSPSLEGKSQKGKGKVKTQELFSLNFTLLPFRFEPSGRACRKRQRIVGRRLF
jgi:hypothetical protein